MTDYSDILTTDNYSKKHVVIAWHFVGFDHYIKTLSEMYDISVNDWYKACRENKDVRNEILGNFFKEIRRISNNKGGG